MKKIISTLLSVLLIVGCVAISATADANNIYTNQSAWVDGQKYLLVMPSCLTEGYMGKGILITNGVVADTVASLKLTDYDCSSVNTKKECNALLSFSTSMDLSQYYFTAEQQGDYFAFKTSDGKYLCAGPQEGKNAWDRNRTYFSDTIVDDALFTGNYITGATGSSDTNLGNNAFKVTSKTGYHLRTLNNGNVICKADADYYQGFVGFYTTGEAVEETPTVDIEMNSGAALRLNVTNGIRFYTQVDAKKIASLITDGYTVELGTLIAPADLLTDKELTFESGVSCLDVKYQAKDESGNFVYYEGGNTIVGSIVEIKESSTSWSETSGNITRDFVGRGYVKVTKDGETTIKYADYSNGDIANNSRSLQYIANRYANDSSSDYSSLNGTYKALVDKWAASVK